MKKNELEINTKKLTFQEYKNVIDNLIEIKKIDKLKLQEAYFDICNNYWIVDKYIARNGQCDSEAFPNTLSTYDLAIKNNFALDIPVQMLDDDNVVCFSHKNISKVLNTTSGYLNKFSLAELKEMKLNDKGETAPTLDEALEHIANRTPIVIEIQNEGMIGKFEDKVLTSLQKYIQKYDCYP